MPKTEIYRKFHRKITEMSNEFRGFGNLSHLLFFTVKYSKPDAKAKIRAIYDTPNRPTAINKVLIVDDNPVHLVELEAVIMRVLNVKVLKIDPRLELPIREQVQRLIQEEAPEMVLMDGNLGKTRNGNELNGWQLIHEMRGAGFAGFIVANSSNPVLNWDMIENGADIAVIEKFRSWNKARNLAFFLRKYVVPKR